jgi:hypothetical protein
LGRRETSFPPVLKAPRQCLFVLLVEERLKEDEALGSEKGKVIVECGLCYDQRREAESGFTAYVQN